MGAAEVINQAHNMVLYWKDKYFQMRWEVEELKAQVEELKLRLERQSAKDQGTSGEDTGLGITSPRRIG